MKNNYKKKNILFLLLTIAFIASIRITLAVSRDASIFNNVFEVSNYETSFSEIFDSPANWLTCETVDKEIKVQNNTDEDIVARVKLEEEWTGENGMGLPLVSSGSGVKMAIVNLTENSGWTLDGTYYYSPTLRPGETSTSVISGVTLNCDANLTVDRRYSNADYKLSAKVQTIQADRASSEWHKISVWSNMQTVEQKIQNVITSSPNYGAFSSKVAKFVQAESLDINPEDISDDNIISDSTAPDSNTPTYIWYNMSRGTLYWYSDADDVYMINNSRVSWPNAFSGFNDLSGFLNVNTSRVTNLAAVFYYYNGTSLHGLEKWDVSNVTSIKDLFWTSSDGHINDISAMARWDVSNVVDMEYVFNGHDVRNVTPLAGWNVRNVRKIANMFVRTDVGADGSICALSDWPINGEALETYHYTFSASKYGSPRNPKPDARCLGSWNIPNAKGRNMISESYFIIPSWAVW